jgi:hypothetical protein
MTCPTVDLFNLIFPQPNDIGLALYDSPVGQLAWIGAKFKLCVYIVYLSTLSLKYYTQTLTLAQELRHPY